MKTHDRITTNIKFVNVSEVGDWVHGKTEVVEVVAKMLESYGQNQAIAKFMV